MVCWPKNMENMNENNCLAKLEKKDIEESLKMLQTYSFWDDEIPSEVIHSDTGMEKQYKARKHWWQSILLLLDDFAKEKKILSPSLTEEVNRFYDKYCSLEFTRRLTTKEDINEANCIIRKVLTEVSENL
jgi:hypothetical protein